MFNTFIRSFIIWEPAIKTWAPEINGGPGTNWGPRELNSEQFPHLGNYTLTPENTRKSGNCDVWQLKTVRRGASRSGF